MGKIIGGLIVQWGSDKHTATGLTKDISFSTSFTMTTPAVFVGTVSPKTTAWNNLENTFNHYVYNISKTGFSFNRQAQANDYSVWLAVGY